MSYMVKFVDEDRLPVEIDWTLIRDGDDFTFVAKRTKLSPLVLAEGWAAYRRAITVAGRPMLAAI